MKTSSCKAKSRRLQNKLCEDLRAHLGLSESDIKPAIMGESGMDIKLSSEARCALGFAVEAKAQESLSIWSALRQTEENALNEGLRPLLVFKRNRSEIYCCMKWADFLGLISVKPQMSVIRSNVWGKFPTGKSGDVLHKNPMRWEAIK